MKENAKQRNFNFLLSRRKGILITAKNSKQNRYVKQYNKAKISTTAESTSLSYLEMKITPIISLERLVWHVLDCYELEIVARENPLRQLYIINFEKFYSQFVISLKKTNRTIGLHE